MFYYGTGNIFHDDHRFIECGTGHFMNHLSNGLHTAPFYHNLVLVGNIDPASTTSRMNRGIRSAKDNEYFYVSGVTAINLRDKGASKVVLRPFVPWDMNVADGSIQRSTPSVMVVRWLESSGIWMGLWRAILMASSPSSMNSTPSRENARLQRNMRMELCVVPVMVPWESADSRWTSRNHGSWMGKQCESLHQLVMMRWSMTF